MSDPFGDDFRRRLLGDQSSSASSGADEVAEGALLEDDDADSATAVLEHDLEELTRLQAERDEYLDALRRVQADFENYRKRVLREQTALVERATETLVEQLLPALDSFELALESLEGADEKVHKGVELVRAQLRDVLTKAGLSEIEAQGRPFDPTVHEAVAQEGDDGDPFVSDVYRTGYRLKDRVLRPATVKVTRELRG
jgi:molecular chaperone GrpE